MSSQPFYECPQSYGQHASLGVLREGGVMVYLSYPGLSLTPSAVAFVPSAGAEGFYIQDVTSQQYLKYGLISFWTANTAEAAVFTTRCGKAPGSVQFRLSTDMYLQFSALNTIVFGGPADFFVDFGSTLMPTEWPPVPIWPLEWLCQPPEPGKNVSLAFYRNSKPYSSMTGDCVDPTNHAVQKQCTDPSSICWDNSRTEEQNLSDYVRCGDKNQCRLKCSPGFTGCGDCTPQPEILKLHYFNSSTDSKTSLEPSPVAFVKNGAGFSLLDVNANVYPVMGGVQGNTTYTPNLGEAAVFKTQCGKAPGSINLRLLIPGNTTSSVGFCFLESTGAMGFLSGTLTDFFVNSPPQIPPSIWPPPPPLQPLLITMGYHRLSTSDGFFATNNCVSHNNFSELEFVKVPGGFMIVNIDGTPMFDGSVLNAQVGSLPGSIQVYQVGTANWMYFSTGYVAYKPGLACLSSMPNLVLSDNASHKLSPNMPEFNPFVGKPPTDWFLDATPPEICNGAQVSAYDHATPVTMYAYQTVNGKPLCIPEIFNGSLDTNPEQVYVLATGQVIRDPLSTKSPEIAPFVTQYVICSSTLLKPRYYRMHAGVVDQTEDYTQASRFVTTCGSGTGDVYFYSENQFLAYAFQAPGIWTLMPSSVKAENCMFNMVKEPAWGCVDSICQASQDGGFSTETCSYVCPYTPAPAPQGFQIMTSNPSTNASVPYSTDVFGNSGFIVADGSEWEFVYAGDNQLAYQPVDVLQNTDAMYFIRNVKYPQFYLTGGSFEARRVDMFLTRYPLHAGLFIMYTVQSPSQYTVNVTFRFLGTYQHRAQQGIEYILGSTFYGDALNLVAAAADDVYGPSPDSYYAQTKFNPNFSINPPLKHTPHNVLNYNTTLAQGGTSPGTSAIMALWDVVDFRQASPVVTNVAVPTTGDCAAGMTNVGKSGTYVPADATSVTEAQWIQSRPVCIERGAANTAQKNVIDMSIGIKRGELCKAPGLNTARVVQNCGGVPMTRAGDFALGYDDSNNMSLYAGYSTALLSPEPRL